MECENKASLCELRVVIVCVINVYGVLEKFRHDARIERGGVGYAEPFYIYPPLVFFQHSSALLPSCCPVLRIPHTQRLNSHANGTAMLNRTTQRLPHSHALNSAFLISSHLCPLPVSLLVFARLQTSMQNIACRVLCIHGLRCLSAVLHPVHKFWLRLLNLK